MKPKVYIETTIVSYLASKPSRDLIIAAHQQIAHDWWETRLADFEVYISQFVLDEAGAGDADAAAKRLALLASFPLLDATSHLWQIGLRRAHRVHTRRVVGRPR